MRALVIATVLFGFPCWGAAAAPAKKAAPVPAARRWLRSLTLSEKAAQLVVIPFYGDAPNVRTAEYRRYVRLVRDTRVGGLVLVNRVRNRTMRRAEPHALAAFVNRMQRLAKIPLIIAGDFERGASMRVNDTTPFPHAMAFAAAGDVSATRFEGEVTAREARALGIHWLLFPVADVNNNPDNPIINIRSYGEDPRVVSQHVRAFIQGAAANPRVRVLTSAKHFPGHGDTATDSHLGLPSIAADRARLEAVELVPFRAAIEQGVDSVMTAHIAAPALGPPDVPATLSSAVLTKLLREEMGFKGIIVTDALDMAGVTRGFGAGEAAVRSLEAGSDVLLMPADPDAAIRALVAAVRKRRLSEKRIEESVLRLLAAKQRVGLDNSRLVDVEAISDAIESPEALERAQQVADGAVTLVRNEGSLVPLRPGDGACFLVLTENRYSTQGQALQEELGRRAQGARIVMLDPTMPELEIEDAGRQASSCAKVVVAAFVSVAAYRGNVALPGNFPKLVETLISSGRPVILVALGNPYLIRSFPDVPAYLTTYSPTLPGEIATAKALFGEIPITGRLPVSIPGIAKLGDGLKLPAAR